MFHTFASSEIGQRDEQQDAFATTDVTLVIADGMGGEVGGAEAARAAVVAIADELGERSSADDVVNAIGWACRQVEDASGGATTIVVAHFVTESSVVLAWVGDSRAYLVRDGEAELLTDDHVGSDGGLSRWLPDEGTPDVVSLELEPGDHLVLCTDGVWGELDEHEIAQVVECGEDDPAEWLVERALNAGASDNCTALVCVIG